MNGFLNLYAIRLPSGELFSHPRPRRPAIDYSMPSYIRDVLGIQEQQEPEPSPFPAIFTDREEAEKFFDQLREQAEMVGVKNWGASIVTALLTPFTPGDPGTEFADTVIHWLDQNGVEL